MNIINNKSSKEKMNIHLYCIPSLYAAIHCGIAHKMTASGVVSATPRESCVVACGDIRVKGKPSAREDCNQKAVYFCYAEETRVT